MAPRAEDIGGVRDIFEVFADAEGGRIPFYASLSRSIARHDDLAGLLLEAPTGQRLPVLVLAAIHDVVLRHPDAPLGRWFPSVTGDGPLADDPEDALRRTVELHRDEIVDLVRHRQVQTNEVNRCVGWWIGLGHLDTGDLPFAIVELGPSAGLNLRLDDYSYRFESGDTPPVTAGRADSPVRLGTQLRTGPWDDVARLSSPIVAAVGIDQRPVDVTDPHDARWLEACTWPEQRVRHERLEAALALAREDPPDILRGDLVDDLPGAVDHVRRAAGAAPHVVVLASWVLAYVPTARRSELLSVLTGLAGELHGVGGRLSLLTLESDHVLPWMPPPALAADASADERHASILAATTFTVGPDGSTQAVATPLARCQAHLVWADRLV